MTAKGQVIKMASGYEKSPDYSGPPPSWRELAVILVIIVVLVGLFLAVRI